MAMYSGGGGGRSEYKPQFSGYQQPHPFLQVVMAAVEAAAEVAAGAVVAEASVAEAMVGVDMVVAVVVGVGRATL